MRVLKFAALPLLASAACVTETPPAPMNIDGEPATLIKLSGNEIRHLLVGRTLTFVAEPGVPTSPRQEIHRRMGRYLFEWIAAVGPVPSELLRIAFASSSMWLSRPGKSADH